MRRYVAISDWALVLAAACTGCATMVNGTYQDIPIRSRPSASAVVGCSGVRSRPHRTPAVIRIRRDLDNCRVILRHRPGFKARTVALERGVSGSFYGNLVCSCLPVGMVVDAANGAMYDFTPEVVDVALEPAKPDPQSEVGGASF